MGGELCQIAENKCKRKHGALRTLRGCPEDGNEQSQRSSRLHVDRHVLARRAWLIAGPAVCRDRVFSATHGRRAGSQRRVRHRCRSPAACHCVPCTRAPCRAAVPVRLMLPEALSWSQTPFAGREPGGPQPSWIDYRRGQGIARISNEIVDAAQLQKGDTMVSPGRKPWVAEPEHLFPNAARSAAERTSSPRSYVANLTSRLGAASRWGAHVA